MYVSELLPSRITILNTLAKDQPHLIQSVCVCDWMLYRPNAPFVFFLLYFKIKSLLQFFSDTFTLWYIIPILTFVCGLWSLQNMLIVILSGGVGKNGSTVAVSLLPPFKERHIKQPSYDNQFLYVSYSLFCSFWVVKFLIYFYLAFNLIR